MADEQKADNKANNDPRPYMVWEVMEGGDWKPLGTRMAVSNAAARKAAASHGEKDGKPRTGMFWAAAVSSVQGKRFIKEMQPVVSEEELTLEAAPTAEPTPAKANGRSRKPPKVAEVPEPAPVG